MFSKKLFHKRITEEGETPTVENDYNNCLNHPSINDVTLVGNRTSADLDLVSVQDYIAYKTSVDTFMDSKGQPSGLATLDTSGKLSTAQVPDLFLTTLGDIDFTAVADGDVLSYDLATQKWTNKEYVANTATGENALAIGPNAKATAEFACQIGPGTNNATKTLNFLGYRILNEDGRIPSTRLRNAAVPDWANSEVRLNGEEYTAETDGTLFIQCNLGQWCKWTVNGKDYNIGGSSGGHMFNFRVGKGDVYKYTAGIENDLRLTWVPDKGS